MSIISKLFSGLTAKKTPHRSRRPKFNSQVESLETRRLLAADVAAIAGDSNGDGLFDSSDIVAVFQAGKFESDQEASYAEGDWNSDGRFNTTDIVFAFQNARYEEFAPLAAQGGDRADVGEGQERGERGEGERPERREGERDRSERGGRDGRGNPVANVIEKLTASIEAGDPPGNLSVDEAQAIIDGLNAAVEAQDRDAAQALLAQVREAGQVDRAQGAIDNAQEAIDAAKEAGEDNVYGIALADAEAAVASASDSLALGEFAAVKEALTPIREAAREANQAERAAERVGRAIERLQAAVDAATEAGEETVGGLPVADVQSALATATAALNDGDTAAARDALSALNAARREARVTARLQTRIDSLQAAVDAAHEAGEAEVGGVAIGDVEAALAAANAALADGDLEAAGDALKALRPERGGDRDGGRGRGGRGDRGDRPEGGDQPEGGGDDVAPPADGGEGEGQPEDGGNADGNRPNGNRPNGGRGGRGGGRG